VASGPANGSTRPQLSAALSPRLRFHRFPVQGHFVESGRGDGAPIVESGEGKREATLWSPSHSVSRAAWDSSAARASDPTRPDAEVPWEFALVSFEGKLRAAGITTAYHGASFQQPCATGPARSVEGAYKAGDRRMAGPVLELRSDAGFEALRRHLSTVAETVLVSHEDHTPWPGPVRRPPVPRALSGRTRW
jgi:hypothetical protein